MWQNGFGFKQTDPEAASILRTRLASGEGGKENRVANSNWLRR
jgi:hypothetical protein